MKRIFVALALLLLPLLAAQMAAAQQAPAPQVVTGMNPADNGVISNRKPSIYLQFDTTQNVDPQSIHFYLDNQEVTSDASISGSFAAYTPDTPLALGKHTVQVTGTAGGQNFEQDWSFTVRPPRHRVPLPFLVANNASGPFSYGQTVVVVMTGPPHGTASFNIGRVRRGIPMNEMSAPGIYVGYYTFQSPDGFQNTPVIGILKTAGGKLLKAVALAPVSITIPFTVTLVSPKDGESVSSPFTVSGRTTPNSDVTLTIKIQAPVIPGYYGVNETPRVEKLRSGPEGNFEMQLSTMSYPGTKYIITAVATNHQGKTSQPVTITVVQR